LYIDLLPLINSARIDLLDHSKLVSQLTNLERRTARGGKDSIDHPPGAHDDIVNAVAGVASCSISRRALDYRGFQDDYIDADDPNAADDDPTGGRERVARLMAYIDSFRS
jgi:hypothetical protein